jgi:ferritin-like metal-binding protein YciE
MKDLKDLLKHEVMDLYSAEEQIIAALPKMIEKANNPQLKDALSMHLEVTKRQKDRLDQVKEILMQGQKKTEKKGLLGLFGSDKQVCKGTQGLVEEGEKMMKENMNPEVMDAAIISCAQKIEHYEISGYGTARAYARELNLFPVAELLEETLDEEYEADDLLTDLAVGRINQEAEDAETETEEEEETAGTMAYASETRSGNGTSGRSGTSGGRTSTASAKSTGGQKAPASKTAGSRGASTSSRTSGASGGSRTAGAGTKAAAKKTGAKQSSSNSRGASSGGGRSSGSGRGASSKGR